MGVPFCSTFGRAGVRPPLVAFSFGDIRSTMRYSLSRSRPGPRGEVV